jgi:hypothetical protein
MEHRRVIVFEVGPRRLRARHWVLLAALYIFHVRPGLGQSKKKEVALLQPNNLNGFQSISGRVPTFIWADNCPNGANQTIISKNKNENEHKKPIAVN